MCIYHKRIKDDLIIIGVYVDDLLSTATKPALVDTFFEELKELKVKDLGVVNKFLGMRVACTTKNGYTLDHTAMIREMVEHYNMTRCNPITNPIAENEEEDREGQEPLDRVMSKRFRSVAGALLWIARCTRPDIGYAMHRMTRRTHAPRVQDWKLGQRILRHLNGTAEYKLHFPKNLKGHELCFTAYSDADFAADREDRKSISASMVFVNGLLVTWVVSKQANVSLSTMESEFIAAARAVQELLGLLELVREVGCPVKLPVQLCMYNQAAISQVQSEASSYRAKHVYIKHKMIKYVYQKGIIIPTYVPTNEMKADLLTKALSTPTFRNLCAMIGLFADTD